MELEFSGQIFEKADMKFRQNPSSWSRGVHADGQTDAMKLIVGFRNSHWSTQ
jgi:hypothetical protein